MDGVAQILDTMVKLWEDHLTRSVDYTPKQAVLLKKLKDDMNNYGIRPNKTNTHRVN